MILLIDNYDSFTYNIYQLTAQLYNDIKVIRNDKISMDDIIKINPKGIILSPGPGRPENAGICMNVIKNLSGQIPILGICLGHQAIAATFGGNVIKSGKVIHGKMAHVFHSRKNLFKNMPLPFEAGRYHSLIVEKESLPSDLLIEAECNEGSIMAIKHKVHKTYGFQFHPESILTEKGEKIISNFLNN